MEAVGVEADHSGPSPHQPRFSAPFQLAIAFAISDLRRILRSNNIVVTTSNIGSIKATLKLESNILSIILRNATNANCIFIFRGNEVRCVSQHTPLSMQRPINRRQPILVWLSCRGVSLLDTAPAHLQPHNDKCHTHASLLLFRSLCLHFNLCGWLLFFVAFLLLILSYLTPTPCCTQMCRLLCSYVCCAFVCDQRCEFQQDCTE